MSNNLNYLLDKYYLEDWDKFFKVIKDNNLIFDAENECIADDDYQYEFDLGQEAIIILKAFYKCWLSHSFNSGFVNLRC